MTIEADLNIAEIPCESGAVNFRYARVMSTGKTRWIRHGLFVADHENRTVFPKVDTATARATRPARRAPRETAPRT